MPTPIALLPWRHLLLGSVLSVSGLSSGQDRPQMPALPPAVVLLVAEPGVQAAEAPAQLPTAGAQPSFRLSADDLARLTQGPGLAAGVTATDAQRPVLHAALRPLVGVTYPTWILFSSALRAHLCRHMEGLRKASGDPAVSPELRHSDCATVGLSAPGPLTKLPQLARSYAELSFTPAQSWQIALLARKPAVVVSAPTVTLAAKPGCACNQGRSPDIVVGFVPMQSLGFGATPVDFGLFDRLSVIGPRLNEAGVIVKPAAWDRNSQLMARTALRHGTQLDVLLQVGAGPLGPGSAEASDETQIRLAARAAVALVNLELDDGLARLRPLALPMWKEARYAFGGLTLMFDGSPATDRAVVAGNPALGTWARSWVLAVIDAMQASGRPMALNLVVPDHWLGAAGAFGPADLMEYVEAAELPGNALVPEGADTGRYRGRSDITVRFLVLLREPISANKKALLAQLDVDQEVRGHRRGALLNAIVPIVFHASGADSAALSEQARQQIDDDLAYFKWNYGGVGLWTLPIVGESASDALLAALSSQFLPPDGGGWSGRLCNTVCPQRTLLRLFWQVLVLAAACVFGVRLWKARGGLVSGAGASLPWTLLACAVLLSAVLFGCDPVLTDLRNSNLPLCLLLAAATFAFARWRWRRRAPLRL